MTWLSGATLHHSQETWLITPVVCDPLFWRSHTLLRCMHGSSRITWTRKSTRRWRHRRQSRNRWHTCWWRHALSWEWWGHTRRTRRWRRTCTWHRRWSTASWNWWWSHRSSRCWWWRRRGHHWWRRRWCTQTDLNIDELFPILQLLVNISHLLGISLKLLLFKLFILHQLLHFLLIQV